MSDQLRFDGQVAVITGAGSSPGLGRSYAKFLAARGAKIVVNDVSTEIGRDGLTRAQRVAHEIIEEGGVAVDDHHSVSEPGSAQAIIATALDAWGKVDILINSAGFIAPARIDEITEADILSTVGVQLLGTIWMNRAVWKTMAQQHYGRILNTSSTVMLGISPLQAVYGATKGGVFSLTRALAVEGADHGILVNAIAPSAGTVGAEALAEPDDPWMHDVYLPNYSPDLVAATAAFLVHQACPVTAGWYISSGGHISEGFFSLTRGIDDRYITIEDLQRRFADVRDRVDSSEAPDPIEACRESKFIPKSYSPVE
jgi:NAD(P)-dependent dehydrogenase (short-subunit alcohol dehydrogenase family)